MKLDRLDRKILQELQRDGRVTFSELANRVGLTTSPCLERVRRLEQAGTIKGYTALLDAGILGAQMVVFVQIRLSRTSQENFDQFRDAVMSLEEVQEAYLISGNFDYLIKARVGDMEQYRRFLGSKLLKLPGVQESTSYVAMEILKETLNIPISNRAGNQDNRPS